MCRSDTQLMQFWGHIMGHVFSTASFDRKESSFHFFLEKNFQVDQDINIEKNAIKLFACAHQVKKK